MFHNLIKAATQSVKKKSLNQKFIRVDNLIVGSEIFWWFPKILLLESG